MSDTDLPAEPRGPAEPPRVPDPDAAEEYAESLGVDPTHDQIDRYLEMEGAEPLGEERPLDEQP